MQHKDVITVFRLKQSLEVLKSTFVACGTFSFWTGFIFGSGFYYYKQNRKRRDLRLFHILCGFALASIFFLQEKTPQENFRQQDTFRFSPLPQRSTSFCGSGFSCLSYSTYRTVRSDSNSICKSAAWHPITLALVFFSLLGFSSTNGSTGATKRRNGLHRSAMAAETVSGYHFQHFLFLQKIKVVVNEVDEAL